MYNTHTKHIFTSDGINVIIIKYPIKNIFNNLLIFITFLNLNLNYLIFFSHLKISLQKCCDTV